MKICIGGDLNGQVVEKDVYSFKAAEIDPEKKSEYFIQSYILGDKRELWSNLVYEHQAVFLSDCSITCSPS
ncbi:hypothetical protein EJ502_05945, partial [Acinetobacter baumannii]